MEKYINAELEIVEFGNDDIIATSNTGNTDDNGNINLPWFD